jgi:hypothetical protein
LFLRSGELLYKQGLSVDRKFCKKRFSGKKNGTFPDTGTVKKLSFRNPLFPSFFDLLIVVNCLDILEKCRKAPTVSLYNDNVILLRKSQ